MKNYSNTGQNNWLIEGEVCAVLSGSSFYPTKIKTQFLGQNKAIITNKKKKKPVKSVKEKKL